MKQSYFISDLHFGHPNILNYMQKERPFASVDLINALEARKPIHADLKEELDKTMIVHNQHIVDIINEYVNPTDTLWIIGDVCYGNPKDLKYVEQIVCRNKNLVLGNHDLQPMANYVSVGFNKIYGMARHKEFVLTHAPVHPCQLEKRYSANIHGHLHTYDVDDPRYTNVNIDRLQGMKPLSLQEIRDTMKYNLRR